MKAKVFTFFLCTIMCVSLVLCTGCQSTNTSNVKQSAEAWLQNSDDAERTAAKVDLSGGWSVEFASGAVYLYDKEIKSNTEAVAMCLTLDEEVYNEYLEAAKSSDTSKEIDGYTYYEEDNECRFLRNVGETYIMITTSDKENANDIVKRFTLTPEKEYYQ